MAGNNGNQVEQPEASAVQEHVQVTPLGLSAEQMRLSNADAVTSIEANAAEAARIAERQRLSDLSAAFGSDTAFVSECVASGISVTEAKAKKFDAVAAQLAEAKTENERLVTENTDLKRRIEATKIGFSASDEGGGDKPTEATIEARIDAAWNNQASGAQAKFNGDKKAFAALMKHSPAKLANYEKQSK